MMFYSYSINMRTTLTIADDIYRSARSLAMLKGIAIGTALSELARRGLERNYPAESSHEPPVFTVSEKAPSFGLEEVREAEDGQ